MPEPIQINTSKYNTHGKVEIDGHIWEVRLPGAGTELRLSQATRASKLYGSRIALLDQKIDAETITSEDLDLYEEYNRKYEEAEKILTGFFTTVFKDSTEDNSEVKKWVEDTPTSIIMLAFDDVKNQANKVADDSPGTSEST